MSNTFFALDTCRSYVDHLAGAPRNNVYPTFTFMSNQSCFMSHKYYCHLFSCFPPTSTLVTLHTLLTLLHFLMANSIFLIIIFALTFSATIMAGSEPELVRSSCQHATFPQVCVHTLSVYSPPANTPRELALAAIKVSISKASKVSEYLSGMQKEATKREKGAVKDCATQISDSVDDLRKTLSEIKELKRGTFRWQMSNAETWVSAALTNEDTCLDGFKEVAGTVRSDVKKKVTNVAKVTSNALYLINRLDHP